MKASKFYRAQNVMQNNYEQSGSDTHKSCCDETIIQVSSKFSLIKIFRAAITGHLTGTLCIKKFVLFNFNVKKLVVNLCFYRITNTHRKKQYSEIRKRSFSIIRIISYYNTRVYTR